MIENKREQVQVPMQGSFAALRMTASISWGSLLGGDGRASFWERGGTDGGWEWRVAWPNLRGR